MATPLRPRAIPQCSACVRKYALTPFSEPTIGNGALGQQVRGKKKMVNTGSTVPVRLLKDVKTFGRKGSIVPISMGRMRNEFFPRRIAEYITLPERKTMHLNNVTVERNFEFGTMRALKAATGGDTDLAAESASSPEMVEASMFQKRAIDADKLTAERSVELVEIFVPPRLSFYRQPIIEETPKEPDVQPPPEASPRRQFRGMGAAADLMEARTPQPGQVVKPAVGPQGIYGSVSTHDVLMAVRETMRGNDEAAMVVLQEGNVSFVGLPESEGAESDRVKHVGDFTIEIKVTGAQKVVRRTARVVAQEA